MPKIKNLKN